MIRGENMPPKKRKKPTGSNPLHLEYVQQARRSNEAGFHGPNKEQTRRLARRLSKMEIKNLE